MKPTVLITFDAGENGRALLQQKLSTVANVVQLPGLTGDQRKAAFENADVLFAWNLPKELADQEYALLKKVRFIQLISAGADHVPFRNLPDAALIASNVGAYAEPMAEHALAMVLALAKKLIPEQEKLRRGEFDQTIHSRYLAGNICGILGFGGIGRATARRMRALGMKIFAVNTTGRTNEEVDFIGTLNDLDKVLQSSDVLIVALPLNRTTRGLIGETELKRMKTEAILVNVARGEILREKDLFEHLKRHPEFQAGIDAWWVEPFSQGEFRLDYPFLNLPNVIGSPHNSALVPGILKNASLRAAENVIKYLEGEAISGTANPRDYE